MMIKTKSSEITVFIHSDVPELLGKIHKKVNFDSTKALITIIGKGYLKSKNLLILLKIFQFKIETVSTDKGKS